MLALRTKSEVVTKKRDERVNVLRLYLTAREKRSPERTAGKDLNLLLWSCLSKSVFPQNYTQKQENRSAQGKIIGVKRSSS